MADASHAADPSAAGAPLLSVRDLTVRFPGGVVAVDGVSFEIARGETLAVVGESGSGKSVSALAALQLLPGSARQSGSIEYKGQELVGADDAAMRAVRGRSVSMIFQEPMTSLNPLHRIERQVGEALELHQGLTGASARERVLELLRQVGLREPEKRLSAFPHQLSGGQRQRVMIAMALANRPDLLIADEPTTALDVTIQAQILSLLKSLQERHGMAILFITHDLNIVRKFADRVAVMKDGRIVETGETARVFETPEHPYTRRLLDAEPTGAPEPLAADAPEIARGDGVRVWFPIKSGLLRRTVGHVKAVQTADFALRAGETLGVVGESGSGKTTLGLALLRLIRSEGGLSFEGRDLQDTGGRALRPLRRRMQIVFQDPYGALSPRMSVEEIIGEGLEIHGLAKTAQERRGRVAETLEEVGLAPGMMDRFPHEFSGGQRQRIAIARAMILKPSLVVLDEPTSALDRTVQGQIVELLRGLQRKHRLAYLFISHDLRVVRALSHRVMVMRAGEVVEHGPVEQIFDAPQSDYTRRLIAAAYDMTAVTADGTAPSS